MCGVDGDADSFLFLDAADLPAGLEAVSRFGAVLASEEGRERIDPAPADEDEIVLVAAIGELEGEDRGDEDRGARPSPGGPP